MGEGAGGMELDTGQSGGSDGLSTGDYRGSLLTRKTGAQT